MPTIAELQIKVNTTDLDRAKKSLDDLAKSSESVGNVKPPSLVSPDETKKVKDLSSAIDEQTRKLKMIEKQRKALSASDLSSSKPEEFARLNQVLDSRVEIINRQGNALDKLAREEQRVTDQQTRRQAQVLSAQQSEQNAIDATLSKLSARYKAEIDYQRTLETLNKARVSQGMMDSSQGISGEQYSEYVKLAQARRDAALAKLDDNKAILSSKDARAVEKAAMAEEAAQLERLIALEKERVRSEVAAQGGAIDTSRTREAGIALTQYSEKLEQVRLKMSQLGDEDPFTKLRQSIDPVSKKLDEIERLQTQLDKAYKSGAIPLAKQDYEDLNAALQRRRDLAVKTKASVEDEATSYARLRGQIDPAAQAFDKIADQQARLNALYNQGKGSIPTAEYQRLNGMLEASRKRIRDLGATTGKTAKEINFAMRGLPAQFTDIVVSLQGGQKPLTVLLQQGGQIKDMFGGIGPALKAMGGYILGLITPLSIAAAAVGVLAVAWYQATEQVSAFKNATLQGGGFSGASAEDLKALRNQLEGITGTAGQAAKALTQLQASGRVSSSVFLQVSEAAIKMQRATGVAIEDTINDFISLGKDPVNAAAALDDKYRNLTSSAISYAQSLVEQGKSQEASKFLMLEMARESAKTADEMIKNASDTKGAWQKLKLTIGKTWDVIKWPFETTPLADQISDLKKEIADIESGKGFLGFFGVDAGFRRFRLNMLEAKKARLEEGAAKKQQEEDDRRTAAEIALQNAQNYASNIAAIDAVKAAELDLKKVRDNGAKLQAIAIRERRTLTQEELKFQKAAEDAAEKRLNDAIKSQRKRDERDNKPDVVRQTSAEKLLSTILQQGAALQNQLETQGKVLSEEDKLEKLKERIRIAEQAAAQGRADADQKSIIASKDKLLAAQQENVELQKGIAAEQEKVRLKNLQASIDARIASNQQKYDDRVLGVGLGDKEKERLRERLELQKNYDREMARLTKQRNERGDEGQGEFEQGTAKLQAELTANQKALEENYRKMDAAQADWKNGASAAWSNYLAEGKNVAGLTQSFFTSAFSSMEDALVGFVTTGKLSFRDLTISILSDLAKIAAKAAITNAAIAAFGGGKGGVGSVISSIFQADGGAWNGGVQYFAKGGTFTNSVVSTPTAFGTRSGLGVMGEAGPEAIMPLTRTSDGQLGVKAAGGGGSTVVAPVSVTVNVSDSGAGSNTSSNNTEQQGRAVQMAIKSEVEKTIQIGLQPGGVLWRAMNNR